MRMKEYLSIFFDHDSQGIIDLSRIYRKLMVLYANNPLKKIMITSSISFEGKSTIATLFALTMAKFNRKETLLIDADFRKPQIQGFFDLPKKMGLAELVLKQANLEECCKPSNLPNLKIMTCGEVKDAAIGLLEFERINEILNQITTSFEFIVIDSPPVMLVGDSVLFAREMDGILLVVKAGNTQREVVKYTVDLLNGAGGKIIGVILNDLGRNLPYYYRPYYYQYYHKN